jgi:hypothetical protein
MATIYNNINTNALSTITNSTSISGSYLVSNGSGSVSWSTKDDKLVEFVEFALKLMGLDLKYSDFENMSESDKIAMIRDMKINKIID